MPSIKYVTEQDGTVYYPVTHERGVRDSDGVTLATKLAQRDAIVSNLGNTVATIGAAVDAMSGSEVIIAWDGASVPVVADIPSGVTVTYNDTDYTGTLAASSDLSGKVYLIGQQDSDVKTQYVVAQNNGAYTWIREGTTELDLSQYKRIDDEVWLTQQEFDALEVKDPTKTYNVYEVTGTV